MHLKFLFIKFIVFLVIRVYEICTHTIILGFLTIYYHNDVPIYKSTLTQPYDIPLDIGIGNNLSQAHSFGFTSQNHP